ncbi:hypothetical protein [Streptomyces showdoensis]|uniref:hypothetical protein n=1 Tax=Streptomyces showdoensis TaxID=68268 RepID=UPI00103FBE6B|nr:hypothetical protein [Streptomyces showdoensis]
MHDSVGHEETEAASRDMLAIASGLGLTPGWGSSRSSRRVYLTEGVVMLDYGHDDLALHVTVAGPWYRSAIGTGRIHISVALDPRPDDQCTDAAAHLAAARARGQVWSGVASPRVAIRGPRG